MQMHLLILRFKDGTVEYFGPFSTFFRANEYGKAAARELPDYVHHDVVSLAPPPGMRFKWGTRA